MSRCQASPLFTLRCAPRFDNDVPSLTQMFLGWKPKTAAHGPSISPCSLVLWVSFPKVSPHFYGALPEHCPNHTTMFASWLGVKHRNSLEGGWMKNTNNVMRTCLNGLQRPQDRRCWGVMPLQHAKLEVCRNFLEQSSARYMFPPSPNSCQRSPSELQWTTPLFSGAKHGQQYGIRE